MKKEDYNKFYIQGSDHYLIPKDIFIELFDEMVNWREESQRQKEVIDKAIEYMKDFIFEPLLTNEDRKLIMYNDNLRNFEKILEEVE